MSFSRYLPVQRPSWMPAPRLEDDSWLDEEIEQEQDERMKNMLERVKRTMRKVNNEAKRKFIFEERKRIVEWKHYATDIETTGGFDVGVYPYLSCSILGPFVTRYYYPPDTNLTSEELDKLHSFAHLALKGRVYSNVRVIKAMRSFAYGLWYYLTFEAVVGNNSAQIFEAKLYEEPPFTDLSTVTVEFLRPDITPVIDFEVSHIAEAMEDQWTIGDSN